MKSTKTHISISMRLPLFVAISSCRPIENTILAIRVSFTLKHLIDKFLCPIRLMPRRCNHTIVSCFGFNL